MPRTRVTALVIKNDCILMMHRVNNGNEYWVLPGGGLEDGETLEGATLRELKEETSIEATVKEKVLDFVDDKGDQHVVFLCNYLSGEAKLDENSEEANNKDLNQLYDPQWVSIEKIKELTMYPIKEKEYLLNYEKQNRQEEVCP